MTYVENVFDRLHGELLVESVESRRSSAPVLGLTISGVVLLLSLALLLDSLFDRGSPFIL
jgi:hypothetical protein